MILRNNLSWRSFYSLSKIEEYRIKEGNRRTKIKERRRDYFILNKVSL